MTNSNQDDTRPDSTTLDCSQRETTATSDSSVFDDTHHTDLPETIGHYKIIRSIGEGGMGSVYEAEQESPKRRVALKVIKAGATSERLLKRFEIEAQILGKLDHPGIATIYEAGTFGSGTSAQPFFAMEYVKGELLTEYAFGRKLSTRERLGLISKIADAVQHAHQKGVIHRDLKPANILVTNEGEIKILDFGVARATDADIQTATMQTDIGQLIGTIPYMSPEQASGDPDALDTRSDVYALGIIAYELLTGMLPYEVERKMIHEAVRVIREDEPKTLSSINKIFRGDVEIIVGKALIKEKDRRYQSASNFASDIQRYLNNEPIEARPPSTMYQLSKFSKRNKALVAGVAAVLVVSVVGGLVSINFALGEAEQKQIAIDNAEQAREAQQEAEAARTEESKRADELQQVADFQSEQLGNIEIEMMGTQLRDSILEGAPEEARSALSDLLDSVNFTNIALGTLEANIFIRTLEAIDTQFADQPVVLAQMLQTTGDTLRDLGLLDLATDPQERALAIRREQFGDDHRDTLISINNMGSLLNARGNPSEAEPYFREALEGHRRVLGDDHRITLESINNMGSLLQSQGKLSEAEPYYREALEWRRRVLGDEHPDTLVSFNNMGSLLNAQGNPTEAEPFLRETLRIRRLILGDEHPDTLVSISNLGGVLHAEGKLSMAEPYYQEALDSSRRILGDEHPDTLGLINNMGALRYAQGKHSEAELFYSEAMESYRRILGDEHPMTLNTIGNMRNLLYDQGKLSEAELYSREIMHIHRRVLGDEHPVTLSSISNVGYLLYEQGKNAEAEHHFYEVMNSYRRVFGDKHPDSQYSMKNFAALLDNQSRWSESENIRQSLVDIARGDEPEDEAQLGSALVQLGINLIKQEQYARAGPVLQECLDIRKRVMPVGHWLIWTTQSLLGETMALQFKFVEAEGLLLEAAGQIQPPEEAQHRRDEAIQRVVDLYTAWHAAEPENGYDTKAEKWRGTLADTD